jgi:hypothetical protein
MTSDVVPVGAEDHAWSGRHDACRHGVEHGGERDAATRLGSAEER